jgi:L-threonylcarbamoyladenylate synthase
LVVFPTDTVYGVAADPFSEAAIENIFDAKGRDQGKAIAVLVGSADQLPLLSPGPGSLALRLAERFWPGPLTLVIPRHPDLPRNLSQYPTLGVRIPDHPVALKLLRQAGPLATSSANRSGHPDACTAGEALEQLDGRVDLILDGGRVPGGIPSTVVDCSGETLVLIRQGPIPFETLLRAVNS